MFKGLKSKLEDSAKKIQTNVQASVSQYSEQISQQFRDISANVSEAGSEAGSTVSRRFHGPNDGSLNYSVGNALMEEVTEADLLGLDLPGTRVRRDSGGSTHSNESSLSALFASVPGLTGSSGLDTLDSDIESVTDGETSFAPRTPREQGYKNRYVDLVKKYNQVVTENNKCRTILQQSQDKAITRIAKLKKEKAVLSERLAEVANRGGDSDKISQAEARASKYEELLEKAKGEISRNRKEIALLTEEQEKLKASIGDGNAEQALSELAANRVAAEWKDRFDKVEEQWTERLNKAEGDGAITLAKVKAEMHAALEGKDREIADLRSKCKTLEIQDGQANERWQKKVDELRVSIAALEAEKSEQVERLSEAKTQGVKAVQLEEAAKRDALKAELEEEMRRLSEACDERVKEVTGEAEKRIEEMKSHLSSASAPHADDALHAEMKRAEERIEELVGDLRAAEEKWREGEERRGKQVRELEDALEAQLAKSRGDIAELIKEHEDIVTSAREQSDTQLKTLQERYDLLRREADQLRANNDELEGRLQAAEEGRRAEEERRNHDVTALTAQLTTGREQLAEAEARIKETQKVVAEQKKRLAVVEVEAAELEDSLISEKSRADQDILSSSSENARLEAELAELREMLHERNATVRKLEQDKAELEVELASSKELSAMHEHLRDELEAAIKSRTEAECRLLEIEERASRAERQLEADRLQQEAERREREERELKRVEEEAQQASDSLIDMEEWGEPVMAKDTVAGTEATVPPPGITVEETTGRREEEEEERKQWEERVHEAQVRIAVLDAELAEERAATARAEEARRGLEEEIEQISRTLTELRDHLEDSQRSSGESDKLRQDLETARQRADDLQKALGESQTDCHSVRVELGEAAQRVLMLEEAEKKASEEVTRLHGELLAAEQKAAKLQEELSARTAGESEEVVRLQSEIADLKQKTDGLERALEESEGRREEVERRAEEAEKKRREEEERRGRQWEEVVRDRDLAEKERQVAESRATDFETRTADLIEALQEEREIRATLEERLRTAEETAKDGAKAKNEEMIRRVADAEGRFDRLRVEFIAKEKALADLRQEVEEAESRADKAERRADEVKARLDSLTASIQSRDEEERLRVEGEEKARKEREEESEKIKEQYATALHNAKQELEESRRAGEELRRRVEEMEGRVEEEKRRREEAEEREEGLKRKVEGEEEAWRERVEEARDRGRREGEGEEKARRAEMLMQLDELRAALCSLEKDVDEGRIAKAQLEQTVAGVEQERDMALRKVADKQEELARVENDLRALRAELEAANERMNELAKGDEVKKAKQDGERQKVVRELQKEVKQLYAELGEKQKALEEADQKIKTLEEWHSDERVNEPTTVQTTTATPADAVGADELASMRARLEATRAEVEELRQINDRLQKAANEHGKQPKPKAGGHDHFDGLSFAEPTEAEYLRNVLFRYMNERETLGKEIVTLARVIGTVAKFSQPQLDSVITKEESRTAGWLPSGVVHSRH